MRKWIYYCGSWASLIGCLLVASGLESYTGWAMAGCFVGALVLLALALLELLPVQLSVYMYMLVLHLHIENPLLQPLQSCSYNQVRM